MLLVRAQPGARRNGLRGCQAGLLKVCVTQVAEKGKATQAVAEVLCQTLSLRNSQIELLSGALVPRKRFLIRGMSLSELAARIAAAIADQDK
ncbi:MAG: DUF167 domain-containing protein [Pirellulales bacterium]